MVSPPSLGSRSTLRYESPPPLLGFMPNPLGILAPAKLLRQDLHRQKKQGRDGEIASSKPGRSGSQGSRGSRTGAGRDEEMQMKRCIKT